MSDGNEAFNVAYHKAVHKVLARQRNRTCQHHPSGSQTSYCGQTLPLPPPMIAVFQTSLGGVHSAVSFAQPIRSSWVGGQPPRPLVQCSQPPPLPCRLSAPTSECPRRLTLVYDVLGGAKPS